jgi:hypothetical protein
MLHRLNLAVFYDLAVSNYIGKSYITISFGVPKFFNFGISYNITNTRVN